MLYVNSFYINPPMSTKFNTWLVSCLQQSLTSQYQVPINNQESLLCSNFKLLISL